jgi:hypothetical protein
LVDGVRAARRGRGAGRVLGARLRPGCRRKLPRRRATHKASPERREKRCDPQEGRPREARQPGGCAARRGRGAPSNIGCKPATKSISRSIASRICPARSSSTAGDVRHSLAGAIPLAGKTVAEAETFIAEKTGSDYWSLPRHRQAADHAEFANHRVGEVKAPGVYPLPFGGTTTLLQAIAGAGGFTDLASPDRVRIVRKLPNGRQTTLKIRVSDLLDGKGKQQDVPLEPNDVVMVPEVFF